MVKGQGDRPFAVDEAILEVEKDVLKEALGKVDAVLKTWDEYGPISRRVYEDRIGGKD